ncbi:unnamed protein product [Diatraea saccharalis]|uniref:Uncharacterized protein n=1 Tax=Diatraea saccharalis TaxID=40085 RepID=A0A9N9WG25_9NEOP|nr:unnamed protein product [Diatraea saccharalis]
MASSRGARKRTRGGASGASVTSEASDAKRCPPRFTGGARSQPTLASITRAGYDDELEKDSVLLQAAKNYYPEGNCYTPATKSMRLINMPPKRRPPPKLYGPLGDNGELQFPPPKSWQERERERLESERLEKEKHKLQKGLVYLEDLVSGAYDRKKKAEAEAKRKRIEKRRKEKEAAEIAAKEALKK